MTAAGGSSDRDVVPRWRYLESAIETGELEPLHAVADGEQLAPNLDEQMLAFDELPGLYTAGDLLSAAQSSGSVVHEAQVAANYVLASDEATPALTRLAFSQTGSSAPADDPWKALGEPQARISALRASLRARPRNPLRWADLSLAHATLGLHRQARRDMNAALALAPGNRQVVRAASRLFLLREEPDHAVHVLEDAAHERDPWIAASLLSASQVAGRSKTRMRDLRHLLEHSGLAPRHLSELASEMATVELRAGNDRRARKMMRQALADPTENALAQAEWANGQGIAVPLDDVVLPPRPFEAEALQAYHASRYEDALASGLDWQGDQPFDPRPATFVSFVAALTTDDFETAARATRTGLLAVPEDATLRNNLAFALACAGLVDEASTELEKIPMPVADPRSRAIVEATRGLIAYRRGDLARGARLYSESVDALVRLGDRDMAALAALRWYSEAEGRDATASEVARNLAGSLAARTDSGIVEHIRRRLLE